jgi:DNA-binding protein YbaB
MAGDYEKLAADLRNARRSVDDLTGTAESADGLVAATVGATGEVIDLSLSPRIYRSTDSTALADLILATIDAAGNEASKKAFAALSPFLSPEADPATSDLALDPILHQLHLRGEET